MKHRPDPREGADRQRQDHRRELPRHAIRTTATSSAVRQAAREGRRLPRAQGQPVRLRDHEDQRHLEGIPRPLSVQPEEPGRLRGPRDRLRRTGGLPPPHRRSGAQHRRDTACCSCAAPGRSAIRAPPKWSTCSRRRRSSRRGIHALPCIGDGRQSGTSGSPSILNASPEAAAGGGLALLRTGDRVRIDLNKGEANILISDEELAKRRADLARAWRLPRSRRARRRGRRSSAAWSTSSARAWC